MRNLVSMFLMLSLLASCNIEHFQLEEANLNDPNADTYEALFGSPKEIITLPNGTVVEKYDSIYIFQGDIMLTPEQIEILGRPETRGAVIDQVGKKWPNKTVYYTFEQNFPNYAIVNNAISHWTSNTSLTFVPRTNQPDYIIFRNSIDKNSSAYGRIGGAQTIYLSQTGSDVTTAIHEIGHAVGLFHEMSRRDRDSYVRINWNNIPSNKKHNFSKYTEPDINLPGVDSGTFDFNSVMMYHSWAFAIDSNVPTITKLDGSIFLGGYTLSNGDKAAIELLYKDPPPPSQYLFKKTEREYTFSHFETTYEEYEGYDYFHIYFYADKTYKQRIALTEPLRLTIVVIQYVYDRNNYRRIIESEYKNTYPPGTSEITFGPYPFAHKEEYGYIRGSSYYDVSVN